MVSSGAKEARSVIVDCVLVQDNAIGSCGRGAHVPRCLAKPLLSVGGLEGENGDLALCFCFFSSSRYYWRRLLMIDCCIDADRSRVHAYLMSSASSRDGKPICRIAVFAHRPLVKLKLVRIRICPAAQVGSVDGAGSGSDKSVGAVDQ